MDMFREQSTANLVAKTETSQKNTGDLLVLILKISVSIVKSFKFRKEYKVFKFLVRCLIDSCEVFDHQNRIKDFDKPADLESTQDIRVMVYLASNITASSILQVLSSYTLLRIHDLDSPILTE